MVPRAVGAASRLKEESDAYKARIVAQAQGDAQRFKSVLAEYQKAPQVTRDRMYIDAMQQIFGNVTKIMVDTKQGTNLLYLPLDKIIQMTGQGSEEVSVVPAPTSNSTPLNTGSAVSDSRTRDTARARSRDNR